jgi:hypothetical protein
MATKKRVKVKTSRKRATTKVNADVNRSRPFVSCIDQCYITLRTCLVQNPGNAQLCLRRFNLCITRCLKPVIEA